MPKKYSIIFSVIILTISPTIASANSKNLIDYAIIIECGKNIGSGFYINETHIITAKHVVDDCSSARLTRNSEGSSKAEIFYKDKELDIAVLKTKSNFVPVVVLDEKAITRGDAAYIVGTPIDGLVLSKGKIAKPPIAPNGTQFSLSLPADQGNSGGPVFSESGLIGVVTAKSKAGLVVAYDLPTITRVLTLSKGQQNESEPQTSSIFPENTYLPWLQASIIANAILLASTVGLLIRLRKKKSIIINLD
jgi:hypothetical protein